MKLLFTRVSANKKTGPIPTVIVQADTCPDVCPLKKNGCYADTGPLAMHWRRVTKGETGIDFNIFLDELRHFRFNQLWRWGVAGDLPGNGNAIDKALFNQLVSANKNRRGFAYTHKPVLNEQASEAESNREAIKEANQKGFTVNLSANNLAHADKLKALNIAPVVVVLPSTQTTNTVTPNGNRVVVCPATNRSNVNCSVCGLCQKSNRSVIVGFPAHGTQFKRVDKMIAA